MYKYLDHTADILFVADAKTLEQIFCESALAVENAMVDISKVKAVQKQKINVVGPNLELLLFKFLNDLLFYKDADQLMLSQFKVKITQSNNRYALICLAQGEKLAIKRHKPKVDVKAITMHLLEIKESKAGWHAQAIIDI